MMNMQMWENVKLCNRFTHGSLLTTHGKKS